MQWKVPQVWRAKTPAFILGGGPSLEEFDVPQLSRVPGVRVIGCNKAGVDWMELCHVVYFGDLKFWTWQRDLWGNPLGTKYRGLLVSSTPKNIFRRHPRILHLERGEARGLEERPNRVAWNGNTGISAINVAYHFGSRHVYLLGFDMQRNAEGKKNYHEDYPKKDEPDQIWARYMAGAQVVAGQAKKLGLHITNCTPGSAMRCFPIRNPWQVVAELVGGGIKLKTVTNGQGVG